MNIKIHKNMKENWNFTDERVFVLAEDKRIAICMKKNNTSDIPFFNFFTSAWGWKKNKKTNICVMDEHYKVIMYYMHVYIQIL